MLIKTGYPYLFRACDFLCFNVMNYEFENTEFSDFIIIAKCQKQTVIWFGKKSKEAQSMPIQAR